MEGDAKEYSWKYLTASELLSHVPCELVYAASYPSGTDNEVDFYDGESTSGELLVKLFSATKRSLPFSPARPVYCRRGLYVVKGANITGIFVQWRERPQGVPY